MHTQYKIIKFEDVNIKKLLKICTCMSLSASIVHQYLIHWQLSAHTLRNRYDAYRTDSQVKNTHVVFVSHDSSCSQSLSVFVTCCIPLFLLLFWWRSDSIYYNLNPLVCIFTYLKEWKYFYFHVYFLFIAQIQRNNRFSYLYNHSMACLELKINTSHCVSITAPLILNSMTLKKYNQLDFFVNVHFVLYPFLPLYPFFAFCWWEEIQSTSWVFFF